MVSRRQVALEAVFAVAAALVIVAVIESLPGCKAAESVATVNPQTDVTGAKGSAGDTTVKPQQSGSGNTQETNTGDPWVARIFAAGVGAAGLVIAGIGYYICYLLSRWFRLGRGSIKVTKECKALSEKSHGHRVPQST